MRRLALSLLAASALAAVACGGSDDGSGGSLQIDPVNGCVSGGNCKRSTPDDGSSASSADKGDAPAAPDPASDPAPPTPTPPTPTENTCQTALDLGEIAGEHIYEGDPGTPKTITGTCSSWVKIRVKETSAVWSALGVSAELTSGSTQKFDLHGYVDIAADDLSCTTPFASSATTLGPVDDITIGWADSILSNDDSRTVTFEVKSKDGKCAAGATWSLTVNDIADPLPSAGGL